MSDRDHLPTSGTDFEKLEPGIFRDLSLSTRMVIGGLLATVALCIVLPIIAIIDLLRR